MQQVNLLKNFDRNLLINGNVDFSQRVNSFTNLAASQYSADRFKYVTASVTGTLNYLAAADVPTATQSGYQSTTSIKYTVGTPQGSIPVGGISLIGQLLEGQEIFGIYGKTIGISFWVKSSLPGIYNVALGNSIPDRSYVAEYTINSANVWERKTIQLTMDTGLIGTWNVGTGNGLSVLWGLACGTNFMTTPGSWQTGTFYGTSNQTNLFATAGNTFQLSQMMLNLGNPRPVFERAGGSYIAELALCQRYYEKSYDIGTTVPSATLQGGSVGTYNSAQTRIASCTRFKVSKRTTPTITVYDSAGTAGQVTRMAGSPAVVSSLPNPGTNGFGELTMSSGDLQNGHGYVFSWSADAEL